MTSRGEIQRMSGLICTKILSEHGQLQGACAYSIELAHRLGGWVYTTDMPSRFGAIGHYITVAQIERTPQGQVIDVTREQSYVGEVTNVFDFKSTAVELGSLLDVSGWYMRNNYYLPDKTV